MLVLGRQRVALLPGSLHGGAARFQILADVPPTAPPREVAALMTCWAAWAYFAHDSDRLVRRAVASFAEMAPLVRRGHPPRDVRVESGLEGGGGMGWGWRWGGVGWAARQSRWQSWIATSNLLHPSLCAVAHLC